MAKPVTEKIGIRESMRSLFVNVPEDTLNDIFSPVLDLKKKRSGKFDYIHLFVQNQQAFHKQFPKLMQHLQPKGMLWVSWPKAGLLQTDLNMKTIIKMGYDYGLVESKAISLNTVWSAIKFTWPKEKKEYHNHYGKLKEE